MRIEPERLGAALTAEHSLTAGRWGRVSDHPAPIENVEPTTALLAGARRSSTSTGERVDSTNDAPTDTPLRAVPALPEIKPPTSLAQHAPSAELSHLVNHDGPYVPGLDGSAPRMAASDARPLTSVTNTGGHPRRPAPDATARPRVRSVAAQRPRAFHARRAACASRLVPAARRRRSPGRLVPDHLPTNRQADLAGAFAGLALLGLPRDVPYPGRASAVATVAGTALALVLLDRRGHDRRSRCDPC